MPVSNYYQERKFCPACDRYVRFLQSLDESFCVECGAKVRLFSPKDHRAFLRSLKPQGRPGRKSDKRVS